MTTQTKVKKKKYYLLYVNPEFEPIIKEKAKREQRDAKVIIERLVVKGLRLEEASNQDFVN